MAWNWGRALAVTTPLLALGEWLDSELADLPIAVAITAALGPLLVPRLAALLERCLEPLERSLKKPD